MKARWLVVLLVIVIGGGAAYWYSRDGGDAAGPTSGTTEYTSTGGDKVTVTSPRAGDRITSPLKVRGIVPGAWSFEANFGVEILDADRQQVAEGFATVTGDWMTEDPVPFTASLEFKAPVSDKGFVVLHKANPSDDEGRADSVEIPITFGSS